MKCILCPKDTDNRAVVQPDFNTGFLDTKYVYPLCETCYGSITVEQLNKIEDKILEIETRTGCNA